MWGGCQGFPNSDYLEGVPVEVYVVRRVGSLWSFGMPSDCMGLSIGIFRLPINLVLILGASTLASIQREVPKLGEENMEICPI